MNVQVKPLVWRSARFSDRYAREAAETIVGEYEVLEWSDGTFGGTLPSSNRDELGKEFSAATLEDAKAFAEADYERRIRSALHEPAEGGGGDAARTNKKPRTSTRPGGAEQGETKR